MNGHGSWCAAAAAATAAILLTACVSNGASLEVQTAGGTRALVETAAEGGMDAEVIGEVVVGPGDCLGLLADGADEPMPVIWPRGSRLHEDGQGIDVTGREPARVGARFSGGGGEVSDPRSGRFERFPADCLGEADTAIVVAPGG